MSVRHAQRTHEKQQTCPLWFTCLCHLLLCATTVDDSVTLTNTAVTARRQAIPTSPCIEKNSRPGNVSTGGLSKQRQICTWPCLWCGVIAADKLRTDVFGVIFTPPSSSLHDPLFLSSLLPVPPNLGLIVSVIKHSCTDPSLNPLSSVDYMGVKGLPSHSPVTQPCSPHGNAPLFPRHR